MRILLASSEVYPYSKTGGLADMTGALAKYLALTGQTVGIVTPLYSGIQDRFPQIKPSRLRIKVPLGARSAEATIFTLDAESGVTVYFVDQPEFYDRAGIYMENGVEYPDNAERFIFFSKCVVHLARHLNWRPELVHLHDWQTGLAALLIRHLQWREGWGNAPRTCLTIHNQAYQGSFPAWKYELTNLPWDYFQPKGLEFYGMMNCLKAGIVYSDVITTVSPRYAREITTEAFGHGLDGVLRERQSALTGILNGVDYDEWNTTNNPHLKHPYSASNLESKALNKVELQREMGLPDDRDVPLFGTITRLADQKGIDIALPALEEMLAVNMQFVLLGSGDRVYEREIKRLCDRHPKQMSVRIGYDHALAHRIEAGCDFYLMPSKFEPCGLNQMYSLRYGTIPVVRATGGLDDSVVDFTDDVVEANGIKFYEYSSRALAKAIRKALIVFEKRELLQHLRQNGMAADFSWGKTALEYLRLFEQLS
jgi:starch synthase